MVTVLRGGIVRLRRGEVVKDGKMGASLLKLHAFILLVQTLNAP